MAKKRSKPTASEILEMVAELDGDEKTEFWAQIYEVVRNKLRWYRPMPSHTRRDTPFELDRELWQLVQEAAELERRRKHPIGCATPKALALTQKLRRDGLGYAKIAKELNKVPLKTKGGGDWTKESVRDLCKFYGVVKKQG